MTSKAVIAVLAGAGVGVVAAVGLRSRTPPSPSPNPPAPARAASELAVATKTSAPAPVGPEVPETSPLPAAPDDDVPIATKEEFQAAAVACEEKDAGACRRAATAADVGTVVPKDAKRAKTFRRIELTTIVRGCEKGAVAACVTLADRYLRGDGVAQNERTATALIDHAREICSRKPDDACRGVPAN
ncbi:MAG TPA: hypothetical protein VFZ53_21035 [Polyangiaceae bacterium]